MFDWVVEDKTQQHCLLNILMGVANMRIPYSFTIQDVVQYHLIFLAAIELASGLSNPAPKRKREVFKEMNFIGGI
jgi:hypothetical protein